MSEENVVDVNMKKFNELVDEGVPLQREVKEIKQDIVKTINTCIKLRFDRKPNEFSAVVKGIKSNKEDEIPQFLKLLTKVKNIVEYCDMMGISNEYQQYLGDLGLDISLKYDPKDAFSSNNVSSKNLNRFNMEWANLFAQSPSDDPKEVMEKLLKVSTNTNNKIDDINCQIKEDLGDQLNSTGIPKAMLSKAIDIKIKVEDGKEVEESINKFTEDALMKVEAIKSIEI